MPSLEEALTGTRDEWLEALQPFQRRLVQQLLESGKTAEDVAIAWLAAPGPANTASYGGNPNPKFYFDYVLNELEALFCGDEKYANERTQLGEQANRGKPWVVGSVTATIGVKIGVAAAVLGPAVVLVLVIISKVGLKAWCKMRADSKGTSQAQEETIP